MTTIKQKYVVDEKGKKVSVLVGIEDYRKMLEEIEELESIRAYDAAKASKGKAAPFEEAIKKIEKMRR